MKRTNREKALSRTHLHFFRLQCRRLPGQTIGDWRRTIIQTTEQRMSAAQLALFGHVWRFFMDLEEGERYGIADTEATYKITTVYDIDQYLRNRIIDVVKVARVLHTGRYKRATKGGRRFQAWIRVMADYESVIHQDWTGELWPFSWSEPLTHPVAAGTPSQGLSFLHSKGNVLLCCEINDPYIQQDHYLIQKL